MRLLVAALLGLILGMALAIVQFEQAHASEGHRPKISPKVRLWLMNEVFRAKRGVEAGAPPTAKVVLTLTRPMSRAERQDLEARGVSFLTNGDEPRHLGPFYPSVIRPSALSALERARFVARVELDFLLDPVQPLDLTIADIQATDAWPRRTGLDTLTGVGVTVGSLDSGIDPLHPAFFQADGGLYSWIDVDLNGRFNPGTDGVDLDGDGAFDPDETLTFFDSLAFAWNTPILDSDNGIFDPDLDWLYADLDDNGQRDVGRAAGFGDDTPAFGEPIFVAEDLDKDGLLEPNERIRRLSTSKIRAVYENGIVRQRGVDVTLTDTSYAFHGTGTSGIVIAGQPGFSRRLGAAPDAEILMASTVGIASLTDAMIWLSDEGADLVLHEYAPWSGYHLDGSSIHEQAMDRLSAAGIPQVNPAGNLGGTDKQLSMTLAPSSTSSIGIEVMGAEAFSYLQLTILWRLPGTDLEVALTDPTGRSHSMTYDNFAGEPWGDGVSNHYSFREDSSRGTAMLDSYVVGGSRSLVPIPQGVWTVAITNPSAEPVPIRAYLSDDLTSWSRGIAFLDHVAEDGLVCFPATADSAITVAAYAGHVGAPWEAFPSGELAGELRAYSGRGTRIDGASIMDLAAPDNPITPAPTKFAGPGGGFVFGGTSGAGPHVAGAVALLKQQIPTLDGAQAMAVLRANALADTQTGTVPSALWGAGKLRTYRALFNGMDPISNTVPSIVLSGPSAIVVGIPGTFSATLGDPDQDPDDLEVRWDVDYDDSFEAFGPERSRDLVFTTPGPHRVKAEVIDEGGLRRSAALLFEVIEAAPPPLDAGLPDAVLLDTGVIADGGVPPDTGIRPDSGALIPDAGAADTGAPSLASLDKDEGGCGCTASTTTGSPTWAMLGLLFMLVRRLPLTSGRARARRSTWASPP